MQYDSFVTNWMIETVKRDYPDDSALIAAHNTLNLDSGEVVSYFVPATEKGRAFAQTFILGGRGYDLWAIEWERLERFAALEEYNVTVLADAKILWARSEADAARFSALQQKLFENLRSPEIRRSRAFEQFSRAMELYAELLISGGSRAQVLAGYTLDYLSRAIAYLNGSYFKASQTDQIRELSELPLVPAGFCKKYRAVIFEKDAEKREKTLREMIASVSALFEKEPASPREANFQDLADWYAELSYTWLRVRHYAGENDPVKTYMWGIYLQTELFEVCADFGLPEYSLMEYYDPQNLAVFSAKADEIEAKMRAQITDHGGVIREYASLEEFLHEV